MRKIGFASAFAAALMLAGAAQAALLVTTSSGVLTGIDGANTFDTTGVFGTAGLLLNGQAYSLVTTFDSVAGSYVSGPTGSYLGYPVGGATATSTLTVNGTAITITATSGLDEILFSPTGAGMFAMVTDFGIDTTTFNMHVLNTRAALPADLATNGSGNLCVGSTGCGGIFGFAHNGDTFFESEFTASSFTYAVTSGSLPAPVAPGPGDPNLPAAIPEPSAWALMLVGFGMIGAAGRRRRLATS